jgi:hypothetical protein
MKMILIIAAILGAVALVVPKLFEYILALATPAIFLIALVVTAIQHITYRVKHGKAMTDKTDCLWDTLFVMGYWRDKNGL